MNHFWSDSLSSSQITNYRGADNGFHMSLHDLRSIVSEGQVIGPLLPF